MSTQQLSVHSSAPRILGVTRIALGLVFLWAFFDKLFGWRFATAPEMAWIHGGSPAAGFLEFATRGPLAELFQSLAGNAGVDLLFMLGLLGIGTALTVGVAVRPACVSGVVLLMLMWLAVLPPEHHPFLDEHIIYALVLVVFMTMPVGEWLGLGSWWSSLPFVQRHPFFR